jgi:hypothetical protein
MRSASRFFSAGCFLLLASVFVPLLRVTAPAQTITGAVIGTVVDNTGAVIPGADVTLTNEGTGGSRGTVTNEAGVFLFDTVQPGTYTVQVQRPGFKRFERRSIIVSATQRVALGRIELPVGEVTESVTVASAGDVVSLESAEHSGLLTAQQLDLMIARGRDPISLIKVLPGVSQIQFVPWGAESDSATGAGALQYGNQSLGGQFGTFTPNMQGVRSYFNNFSLDGQPGGDMDIAGLFNETSGVDSIAEMKAVLTNYAAEYGRNPGPVVNMVTKSGTREFHGNAYFYKRHENLTANNFFNNRSGRTRPIYRHSNWGFTVGGPAYIPGKFNRNKDRLFFFFGHEKWGVKQPTGLQRQTFPTALERRGDFSRTLDQNGRLIPITDPLSGNAFPGNVIPENRINSNGQALLNLLPMPTIFDRSITGGNYNFEWEDQLDVPKLAQVLRIDVQASKSDSIFIRGRRWWTDTFGFSPGAAFSGAPLFIHRYLFTDSSIQAGYTRIINPSTVNEFNIGIRGLREIGVLDSDSEYNPVRRSTYGITLGQLFPEANPLGLIPTFSFGGVPGAAGVSYDTRFPMVGGDQRVNLTNNFSLVRGAHNVKFGIYFEYGWASEGPRSNASPSGGFDFGRDPNNPFDTNWAYSNALLGYFRQYSETTRRNQHKGKNNIFEWFVQDSWKAMPRLTLNYGLRFSTFSPWLLRGRTEGSAWVSERYDPAEVPAFYSPGFDAQNRRAAVNPITGTTHPAVLIGAFVPGSGDPVNGMVLSSDTSYPDGFRDRPPIQVGGRFGFAYDLFGNGKTALRGGFASTKQTALTSGNFLWETTQNPPVTFTPQIFYGSMDTLLGSQGVLFPSGVSSLERDAPVATIYSYSFGVQHQLGLNTVMDISDVGNVGRHLLQNRDLNTIAPGARFDPANLDPTTGRALSDNFLRPIPGYAGIKYIDNPGISNYNSLQFSANRRFADGPTLGVSYTWSKAMGYTDGDGGGLPLYLDIHSRMYGKLGFDQTHMLTFNYIWDLPKASRVWPNAVVRRVLDGWQLSGITSFASGLPQGVGFSTTDNADITGGGDAARVDLIADPIIPRGERTFFRQFNTEAFGRPARGTFGTAAKDLFRGPGINNWDLTVMKQIPLDSDRRYFQFKSEFYNAFNHTQFFSVDNQARFDPSGAQVNSRFGQVTGARLARYIQLALSFYF